MTIPLCCPACGGPVTVECITVSDGPWPVSVPSRWDCGNRCYLADPAAVRLLAAWGKPGQPGGRPWDWQRDG